MTDQSDTPRTGATQAQIERAVKAMYDHEWDRIGTYPFDQIRDTLINLMAHRAEYLVPPGARIAEPEDLAAIRAALAVIAEMPVRTWAAQGLTVAMIDRLVALAGEDEPS